MVWSQCLTVPALWDWEHSPRCWIIGGLLRIPGEATRLPFRVWELNQRHNYHPQAARTTGNLLEEETKRREQTISDFHGKACWRLSINRLIYRSPPSLGWARSGKTGKVGGEKKGLEVWQEVAWGGCFSATRSLWPAAPSQAPSCDHYSTGRRVNEGWDEMQLRSRLMKYHPTPPVELVLSIVTDNEPIPSKAYHCLA